MTDGGKAVQWRSCPKGHLYLGRECPCQHPAPYRASIPQAPFEGSPGSGPETDRVAGAGRRPTRAPGPSATTR